MQTIFVFQPTKKKLLSDVIATLVISHVVQIHIDHTSTKRHIRRNPNIFRYCTPRDKYSFSIEQSVASMKLE